MDDAALVFRFEMCYDDRFFGSVQAVSTDEQDIFYLTVFQFIQYGKPIF